MKLRLFALATITSLCFTSKAQIYVDMDATGSNDGTTWTNAYSNLQSAMDAALSTDTIWVAEGTYYPTEHVDGSDIAEERNKSFHATGKNISIYGGFSGTETAIDQRDLTNHITIFSGDFNDDDIVTGTGASLSFSNNTENAYHVFVLSSVSESTFDGLMVTGGNAVGVSYSYGGFNIVGTNGGGIHSKHSVSEITISNSTIYKNSASYGGGVFSYSSNTSIVNLIDSDLNRNTGTYGGAVSSNSTLAPSTISTVNINNSNIIGNSISANGGGVYSLSNESAVYVTNSTISENHTSNDGGGIFSSGPGTSLITLDYSTLSGNSAVSDGGAVFTNSYGNATSSCSINMSHSTITENSASNNGGWAFSASNSTSSVDISNSTISGNQGTVSGGGLYSFSNAASIIEVESSILSTNPGDGSNINNNGSPTTFISNGNNIFSGAFSGNSIVSDQINVTSTSLNLQPLAYNGGDTQTMLPGVGSVAIDAGNPSDLTDAQNRPILDTRDIGAADYFCTTNETDAITSCDQYTWVDGTTYTTTNNTATHTVFSNSTSICDTIYTLDLTILALPDVTTTQTNGVNLLANTTGATYQWIDCNNANSPIIGETNQSFTATSNGNYAVIISENGCSDTSLCIVVDNVSVIENGLDNFAKLYPNPTSDVVSINISDGNQTIYMVTVYNLIGEVVLTQQITNTNTLLNTSQLKRGVYLIEVSNEQTKQTLRLIKQ